MTKKLKIGVIGTGGIFHALHSPVYLNHPEAELTAVCDIIQDKAQSYANVHGISNVYQDYRKLLEQSDIDAVDICTPNLIHSEITIAALKAGKHVLCEKPDAINSVEALKMAQAAEESGKLLMVMRNNRFRPASQFLKDFIEKGHMGEIYTGRCGWIRRRGIPGKGGWFTTKELSGGGPLIDLGVHFIDLAVWLMGNPKPMTVTGATYTKFAESNIADSVHSGFGETKSTGIFDVEDLASGFIRFQNGASLQLEFSWASNIEEEMNFLELRGTKAGFSLRNSELKIFGEIEGVLCNIEPKLAQDSGGHKANIEHFIKCIQGSAKPIFVPEQGVQMIKILSAIYESAESNREVVLV
jgi:predicted dehydrogenase